MRRITPAAGVPPIQYDGQFWWYTDWFDSTDDRCSRCRGPIGEDDVPLCLFKEGGAATWQARFCATCTPAVVTLLQPKLP